MSSSSAASSFTCASCGRVGEDVTAVCARCRRVVYCGRVCQKEHWKLHKQHCTAPPATTEATQKQARKSRPIKESDVYSDALAAAAADAAAAKGATTVTDPSPATTAPLAPIRLSLPRASTPAHPLLSIKEIKGKGRGFVAAQDIAAGSLLFTERCIYAHSSGLGSNEKQRAYTIAALTCAAYERTPHVFDHLCAHEATELVDHAVVHKSPLKNVSDKRWEALVHKVEANHFESARGMMLAPTVAIFNHNCYPNADLVIRDVEAGMDEIEAEMEVIVHEEAEKSTSSSNNAKEQPVDNVAEELAATTISDPASSSSSASASTSPSSSSSSSASSSRADSTSSSSPLFTLSPVSSSPSSSSSSSSTRVRIEEASLYAISDIPAGSEVEISYLGSDSLCRWYAPSLLRQSSFESQWGFRCSCPRCEGNKAKAIDKSIVIARDQMSEEEEKRYTNLVLADGASSMGELGSFHLLRLYRDLYRRFQGDQFWFHYILHQIRTLLIFMPSAFNHKREMQLLGAEKHKEQKQEPRGQDEWLQLIEHHLLCIGQHLLNPMLHSITSDTLQVILSSSDHIGRDSSSSSSTSSPPSSSSSSSSTASSSAQTGENVALRRKVVELALECDDAFHQPTFAKLYPDTKALIDKYAPQQPEQEEGQGKSSS